MTNYVQIRFADYLSHIEDKANLFTDLMKMCALVRELPEIEETKEIKAAAGQIYNESQDMFSGWAIPRSYLVTKNLTALKHLILREVEFPEDDECSMCCPYKGGIRCCDIFEDEECEGCGDDGDYEDDDWFEDEDDGEYFWADVEDGLEIPDEVLEFLHIFLSDVAGEEVEISIHAC